MSSTAVFEDKITVTVNKNFILIHRNPLQKKTLNILESKRKIYDLRWTLAIKFSGFAHAQIIWKARKLPSAADGWNGKKVLAFFEHVCM